MNSIVHRVSLILAFVAFGISVAISFAAGISPLGMMLRATLGFVVVGAISRILFGATCGTIARDVATEESPPTGDEGGQNT